MKKGILIYGSYGYTGTLIVDECKRKGIDTILSGRDDAKLKRQSEEYGYPYKVCLIDDRDGLTSLLRDAVLVIHCGGPFIHTARLMVEACLQSKTHYVDITGEIEVFEMLMKFDEKAKESGIMILPGAGFDVVPTDGLAIHLRNKLPDATHLQLAFRSGGGMSRGTINTIIGSLGRGGTVRKNGKLAPIVLGERTLDIDFGSFRAMTLCIPWGDNATAYWSTGIPNTEVYTAVKPKVLRWIRFSKYFNWLLRMGWLKSILLFRYKNFTGPGEQQRRHSKAALWGRVKNERGISVEARLEVASGYTFTARSSVLIASKVLNGNLKPGYQTPSTAYGEELVSEVEGTVWH